MKIAILSFAKPIVLIGVSVLCFVASGGAETTDGFEVRR